LTSKELLSNKENLLKESQKSRSQLVKALETSSKDLKKAQESISEHNNERGELTSNHHDLRGQVKSLETAFKKANNEDDARVTAKMACKKEMAVPKLKGEELHFTREMRRKQDQDDRVKLGFTQCSNLMEFTSRVRAQEKEKEWKRKEMEKQKKTKATEKRLSLSHATARMNKTTMLNGGAFPRPGVSLHEALESVSTRQVVFIFLICSFDFLTRVLFPFCC
jgi:myosin heavy subunit